MPQTPTVVIVFPIPLLVVKNIYQILQCVIIIVDTRNLSRIRLIRGRAVEKLWISKILIRHLESHQLIDLSSGQTKNQKFIS